MCRETRLVMLLRIIEPGLPPQLTGDLDRIDAGRRPPGLLIADAMDRAVMRAAERDGEFIARFAAERPRLQVAEMMRIGLFAAADEARLLGDVAKVLAVSIAPRCRNGEHALVDALGLIEVAVSLCERLMATSTIDLSAGAASSAASTVADGASSDSLCSKASSTSLASAAASRFLAASASRAQIVALSVDVMFPTAVNSFSRNAADCSGSRVPGRSPWMP